MIDDPGTTHRIDQVFASVRTLAGCFATFYHALLDEQVPPSAALTMTVAYIQAFQASQNRPPDKED